MKIILNIKQDTDVDWKYRQYNFFNLNLFSKDILHVLTRPLNFFNIQYYIKYFTKPFRYFPCNNFDKQFRT